MNIKDLYNVSGRTIVITGGTGVLCSEIAKVLMSLGANVAIPTRSVEKGGEIFKDTPAEIIQCDILDKASLESAREKILAKFGRIDGLINGAGGNSPQATVMPDKSFFDLPKEGLQYVFDLNLMGTVLPTQVFGKPIAEQNEGVILNISSMTAIRPLTRVVGYSAAKAAIDNFTRWMAVHMAQKYSPNIRVNAIAPGFFLTEQNRSLLTDVETGELTDRGHTIIAHTPMNRFGTADDLTGTALWLLSPASLFVTGIVVPVDGGFSAFSGV